MNDLCVQKFCYELAILCDAFVITKVQSLIQVLSSKGRAKGCKRVLNSLIQNSFKSIPEGMEVE